MENHTDEFELIAQSLIEESKEYYTIVQIQKLKDLVNNDRKSFVKYFKELTGATDWDLPDIIFAYS